MLTSLHLQVLRSSGPAQRRPDTCVVCRGPLQPRGHAVAADPYPACHAIACRMVVSRRAEMGEANFRDYLRREASQRQERMASNALSHERRAAEAAENAMLWTRLRALARLQPGAPGEALQLVLPSGPRRARALTEARRARYRAHVEAVAAQAAAMPPGAPAAGGETPAGPALPGRLCGLCGGGCCTRGSDHAYLSAATLRRVMDARPGLSREDIVALYSGYVAARTQVGSCINHTGAGCSMPRALRSDICNDFACESLRRVQAAAAPQTVLVVRRAHDQWVQQHAGPGNDVTGAAVLRETGMRRMALR